MIRNRQVKSAFLLLGAVLTLATACQGPPGDGDGVLLAYVANAGANHVQVVDLETGETLRKIYSGVTRGGWCRRRTAMSSGCSTGRRRRPP